MPAAQAEHLLDSLKAVAAVLRSAEIPFAVGGGLAAWARGGPPTEKDIDLMVRESDVESVLTALQRAGLRTERPPEGWLVKAYDGDVLVDLIHAPSGITIDDAFLARCDELTVHALPMLVMTVNDLMGTKLMSLTEHHLDYGPVLEIGRALREQIDWCELWTATAGSPFARAFFTLVAELGIMDRDALHGVAP